MPQKTKAFSEYDPPTAVTFLLIGLCAGALLTVVFSETGNATKRSRPTGSPNLRLDSLNSSSKSVAY